MKILYFLIFLLTLAVNSFAQGVYLGISSGYSKFDNLEFERKYNIETSFLFKFNKWVALKPNFAILPSSRKIEYPINIFKFSLEVIVFPSEKIDGLYSGAGYGYYFNDSGENLKEFIFAHISVDEPKIVTGEMEGKYGFNLILGYLLEITHGININLESQYVFLNAIQDRVLVSPKAPSYTIEHFNERIKLNHYNINLGLYFKL